jgi:hypothetical protein
MNEMKDRYPRTAGEFAGHGRQVVQRCQSCGHTEFLDPQLIIFTFGEDFDLYDGFAELRSRLNCCQCGEPAPQIRFHNAHQKHFEPVSFDEALTSDLEFSAFARARDADEPRRPYRGRYRKFRPR